MLFALILFVELFFAFDGEEAFEIAEELAEGFGVGVGLQCLFQYCGVY